MVDRQGQPEAGRGVASDATHRHPRRRFVAWILFISLSGTVTLAGPGFLRAGVLNSPASSKDAELTRLSRLLRSSREVLSIRPRGESPFLDITLWLHDGNSDGQINPTEVAVLTHCRARNEISLHQLDPGRASGQEVMPDRFWTNPGFCDHWRAAPDVRRDPWAGGISDLRVQTVVAPVGGVMTLAIELDSQIKNADAQSRGLVRVRTTPDPIARQE